MPNVAITSERGQEEKVRSRSTFAGIMNQILESNVRSEPWRHLCPWLRHRALLHEMYISLHFIDWEFHWNCFELFMRISGAQKILLICLVYNRVSSFYKATPSLIETTLS